jgi:hypothetical protein
MPANLVCVQVKIQALSFSAEESMLASLGGQDDNSLVSATAQDVAAATTAGAVVAPPLAEQ